MPWVKEGGEQVWREGGKTYVRMSLSTMFIVAIACGTAYLFWNANLFHPWLIGLFFSGLVLVLTYGLIGITRIPMSRGRDVAFLLFTIVVTVTMMQPDIQSFMRQTTGFQLASYGLLDQAGQVILNNQGVAMLLIGLLISVVALRTVLTPRRRKRY